MTPGALAFCQVTRRQPSPTPYPPPGSPTRCRQRAAWASSSRAAVTWVCCTATMSQVPPLWARPSSGAAAATTWTSASATPRSSWTPRSRPATSTVRSTSTTTEPGVWWVAGGQSKAGVFNWACFLVWTWLSQSFVINYRAIRHELISFCLGM